MFSAQLLTLTGQEREPSHHLKEKEQAELTPSFPSHPCPADAFTHPVPQRPRARGTLDQAAAGAARWAGWSTASARTGLPGAGPGPLAHPARSSGAGGARQASQSGSLVRHPRNHLGSRPRSPLWSPLWLWRKGLSAHTRIPRSTTQQPPGKPPPEIGERPLPQSWPVSQGVTDDAGPIGADPVSVELEWSGGLVQVGHSKRHTEL